MSLRSRAHWAVANAIARGKMQPANAFKCVDCGKGATQYDHRDYAKPLEVEPVCRSCNNKRGTALNHDREGIRDISIRFPDDLHEALKELAWRQRTSVNALVVSLAQQATKSLKENAR